MNSGRHELVFSKKLNLVVEHYQCMGEFSIFSNGAHLGYTGKIAYYNMEMGLHNDNATQFLSKLPSGFRDDFNLFFYTIRYMLENLKTSEK